MISELLKSERVASNSMMLVSAALHLVALIAIIVVSYSFISKPKTVGPLVTNVKLIETGVSKIELVSPQNTLVEPAIAPISREFTEPATAHTPSLQRLTSSFSEAKPAQNIQLQKRKKIPKKIEEPKVSSNPKKPPEKEPDNSKYLEKRLSELRSKMQERKRDTNHPDVQQSVGSRVSGKSGITAADTELSHWFELVKNKVNTHWSLLGDQTKLDKITVIGVQITEDGKLLEASIDSSSGDKLFDNSALRAVFHAAPFPAVPQDVSEKIKQSGGLALRFTPGGMQ